ncbi:MAG: 1,4-dihydroxy-2-naphthoate octaprenyltransferase [Muribaculaceae bacterium]|nr:1,4-dihydroxy-2-naphthoate octaprenyltransferase [Muribaculaceae bacterium]
MKKVRAWIEAMRLRTLPVSVAGVFTAWGFCLVNNTYKVVPALLCLIFAVLCQIASNFANEYYDFRAGRDRAGRVGPRRGVTEGDLSPRDMLYAIVLTLILAATTGLTLIYWGGWWLIAAGLVIGIGSLAYSAGPWPLSTHCLGEVAVFLFFGIVPVNLTYYVQALAWSMPVFLASCSVGLMGANVLIVNNYRDVFDDKAVAKHTLATQLGRRAMVVLYIFNSLLSVGLMTTTWLRVGAIWLVVPLAYILFSIIIALKMSRGEGASLNPLLGMTSMLMCLYAIGFLLAVMA